jgi:hypothetical protein
VPRDFFLPPSVEPPPTRPGLHWLACPWTPESLGRLTAVLREGGAALRAIPAAGLLDAWAATVDAFLDPRSPERRGLDPELARLCRLSPEGLAAGLAAVLGGAPRLDQIAALDTLVLEAMRGREIEPDVVIVDQGLPDIDGEACLTRMRVMGWERTE